MKVDTTKASYKFGKEQKLKSRKAIDALFATGKGYNSTPVRVVFSFVAHHESLQAGFTVSARNFKHAVDRNRIKRLMREAFRLQKNELEQSLQVNAKQLHLFFVFIGTTLPQYDDVYKAIGKSIKKIVKDIHA